MSYSSYLEQPVNPTTHREKYYYQVHAYEYVDIGGNSTPSVEQAPTAANYWNAITGSKSVALNSGTKNGGYVRLDFTVRRESDGKLMRDTDGVKVVQSQSYMDSINKFSRSGQVISLTDGYSQGNNNSVFSFTISGSAAGTVQYIEPNIMIYAVAGSTIANDCAGISSGAPEYKIHANPSYPACPALTFTAADVAPTLPPSVILAVGGSSNITKSLYDQPTKSWIVVKQYHDFTAEVFVVPPPYTTANPHTKYANLVLANNAANAIILKNSKSSRSVPDPKGKGGKGGKGDKGSSGHGVNADKYMSGDQWNPPPHKNTKGLALGQVLDIGYHSISPTALSDPTTIFEGYNTSRLGRMFQDGYALTTKKNPDHTLWGFRFMYNPTSISYSTNTDTSVDWTLGKADPSTALGGNTNVNFTLYLNRMIDIKYLKSMSNNGAGYGVPLSDDALNGLLTRGTEYDLEYLYRVVNGDPQPNQALLQSNASTADLGFITGMPFWLHINDNMRYFGALAGLSVDHAIFTEDMIPVFSTVTISFIRYPATTTKDLSQRAADFHGYQTGGTS